MNYAQEWQHLKRQLRERDHSAGSYQNQFYRRLLTVLRDDTSQIADQLLAYRDALLGSDDPESEELPSKFDSEPAPSLLRKFGLGIRRSRAIFLQELEILDDLELGPVYRLQKRRFIHTEMIDPALQGLLGNPSYSHYNGKAQQLAVRLAITEERNSTLIINLPTGCGKTLVAHATSLFSSNSHLTLVIVPTIGLAIEQGVRAQTLFADAGIDHGGLYFWHGGQTKEQHDDIKNRIKDQRQRILFCSPEAACRSLLPTLFQAASANSLANIVIDEAHVVDQWGTEFRPYFQIIASLTRSLRSVSTDGIKCLLMSATFTDKSLRLVQELFGVAGKPCTHVNGCFLRPEIQYGVKKVSEEAHLAAIVDAAVALPKPMIIYTLYPEAAESIRNELQRTGLGRVGLFTGQTSTNNREELVAHWGEGELDIMVATSAFGLGMDKADVRSVIHAAVPENLDRFYQEIGRGGRDGLASQSLLIYHHKQISEAKRLNSTRLITVELGLEKWRAMWEHGTALSDGRRNMHVTTLRGDQQLQTEGNEEWNWRTLLLMQRARLIRIELNEPSPPPIDSQVSDTEYGNLLKKFYDNYYDNVVISSLTDDPLNPSVWDEQTRKRRNYEKSEQNRGFEVLLEWLEDIDGKSLCDQLIENYTLEGIQPEYACGGCPKCQRTKKYMESSTVGGSVESTGTEVAASWSSPLTASAVHQYVYYPRGGITEKRLIRSWAVWIRRLIESGSIKAIRADEEILRIIQREIRTASFWIGDTLDANSFGAPWWPRLVLHTDLKRPAPRLSSSESVELLMAPEEIVDDSNSNRKWWESVSNSISLSNFLLELKT